MALVTISETASGGDILVLAAAAGSNGPVLLLNSQSPVDLLQHIDSLEGRLGKVDFDGSLGQSVTLDMSGYGTIRAVLAIGVGQHPSEGLSVDQLRDCAATALRVARRAETVVIAIPAITDQDIEALALGACLGSYGYSDPTRPDPDPVPRQTVLVCGADSPDMRRAVEVAEIIGAEVNATRDLVNAPPNRLTPDAFVEIARKRAVQNGLSFDVVREPHLAAGGFGGLSAVGSGSTSSPALIRVQYAHPNATAQLAVVGKGITYDSGGISLKPVGRNETMKIDMAGAAAALGAICAVAALKQAVDLTVWLMVAENMPSGNSMRPGDVLTMYNGTTVEVVNTDAEGRLVLADGIARAAEDGPSVIVDIATLTGEMMSALGARTIGLMSNDDGLASRVRKVCSLVGEACWSMPVLEDVRAGMKSEVADLANMGHRLGGGIAAGLFLEHFVPEGVGWIHLDIAGPSFNEGEAYGSTPKGATGSGVRTLVGFVKTFATTE